jgi:hypothetical protein
VRDVAFGLGRHDPESAIRWATEIQDPGQSSQAISIAAGWWVREHRAAAHSALKNGNVPETARATVDRLLSNDNR